MAVSPDHTGWRFDPDNNRLDFFLQGTRVGHIAAAAFVSVQPMTGTTWTGTGDVTLSGDGSDFVSATGNVQIGTPGVFATTQPQGGVVMGGSSLGGVAPSGTITTAGAIFSSDTVVRKIIADATASNVET